MARVQYEYTFENLTDEWLQEAARSIMRLRRLEVKHSPEKAVLSAAEWWDALTPEQRAERSQGRELTPEQKVVAYSGYVVP